MPYAKGRHPGAIWKKTDFQIHTPRDPQWNGPHYAGGTAATEAAREKWADDFLAECVRRSLAAVAITDHHDFCFVPYVQRAVLRILQEDKRPWVFPGTEITCNDSAQCLVLFDVGSRPHALERLVGGHLPAIMPAACELEVLPQAILCGKDIPDVVNGIADDAVLKKTAIALPHASDEGAHKSIMRQGFHERFKSLPSDGVYTDKPLARVDQRTIE